MVGEEKLLPTLESRLVLQQQCTVPGVPKRDFGHEDVRLKVQDTLVSHQGERTHGIEDDGRQLPNEDWQGYAWPHGTEAANLAPRRKEKERGFVAEGQNVLLPSVEVRLVPCHALRPRLPRTRACSLRSLLPDTQHRDLIRHCCWRRKRHAMHHHCQSFYHRADGASFLFEVTMYYL